MCGEGRESGVGRLLASNMYVTRVRIIDWRFGVCISVDDVDGVEDWDGGKERRWWR